MRYRDAGVDVSRADAIKDEILREIRSTWSADVAPLTGGFAGVMRLPAGSGLIAATMDGVGTKLHLAKRAGRLQDAAVDLVYHGANDLLANGARPFALPYRGRNVMDVGLGPAGYTLSQHLLQDGFGVVGIDGLKTEPLPADLLGADVWPQLKSISLGASAEARPTAWIIGKFRARRSSPEMTDTETPCATPNLLQGRTRAYCASGLVGTGRDDA